MFSKEKFFFENNFLNITKTNPMERDPLLSQSGGRPPNGAKKKTTNSKHEKCSSKNYSNVKIDSNPPDSKHKTQTPNKNVTSSDDVVVSKQLDIIANASKIEEQSQNQLCQDTDKTSQLGKHFYDAVFANQLPSTTPLTNIQDANAQKSCENHKNNVQILENIQIPNLEMGNYETFMDHESISISSIEDEFRTVKNKKRKFQGDVNIDISKCQFNKLDKLVNNINRTNKYSLLGDLNLESENPHINKNPINSKINNDSQPQVRSRNTYCPPIFLENINVKSLIDQLNSKNVEFKIKNQSKYRSKLYFRDPSAHSEMMQLLKEKEISSYTYTPKEYKRQSLVCRGLYYKSDIDDIKTEIDSIVPDTVDSITKFSTEYSRKQGIDTGLFLVILKPNRRANELLGVKYILNQVVSWERPKASTKVPQCWRCQKWGHYSRNCSRPFSCVKCNEKHSPGECKFVPENNELPFCVNCNESGHTSNYRGCPAYKKYVKFRKDSLMEARNRKLSAADNVARALNASNNIVGDRSFSSLFDVMNVVQTQNRPEKPVIIQEFMKIAKILCAPEPMTLEDKIYNFMQNYKSMGKVQAKQECLSLIKEIQDGYGP